MGNFERVSGAWSVSWLAGLRGRVMGSLVFAICLGLLLTSSAAAQATINFLSPSRIAQGYPANAATFRLGVSFGNLGGAAETVFWNNGGSLVPLPFSANTTPTTTFATVDAPVTISGTLGQKTIRVCRANNSICTNDALSEKLSVVRPQVTDIFYDRVTQGAGQQTIYLEYLLARSDGPIGNPTVYIVNAQGTETAVSVQSYSFPEGQTNERYVDVVVPASFFQNLGIYRFRVVEAFDVGPTPQSTDTSVAQATLEVVAPAQFQNPSILPPATLGQPYSTTLTATGGSPYLSEGPGTFYNYFEYEDTLPAGLSFFASFEPTADLQGTPTGPAGKYTFTLAVSDRFNVVSTKVFRLGIQTPASDLSITTATLPQGRINEFYLSNIAATGGVPGYDFAIAEGGRSLPTGLELQPDGTVIGVPTSQGTFTVDIYAEDSQLRQTTRAVSITILPPYPPVLLTSVSPLPPGRANTPYDFQFGVTGGLPPYFFFTGESGNPPPGLTLSSSGRLTGIPTTPGTYQFGVGVFDSRAQESNSVSDFRSYTLVIQEAVPPPEFTTGPILPIAEVGTPYLARLEATGGIAPLAYVVGVGRLPAGLVINETTGVISGTPTTVSVIQFPADVFDARRQSDTQLFTIEVVDQRQPLSITTTGPLPNGTLGDNYSTAIAATGGLAPYTFSVSAGSLPPGLSLNAQSGGINGVPTQAGTFPFTIAAASADGKESVTRQFTIQILSTVRLLTQSPLPQGLVGSAYSLTFVAERGTQPYLFSIIDGQVPNGLTLNPTTGALTGTPTAPFDGSFTLRVRDSASPAAEATGLYQIRILQPLELTVLQLPTGTTNVPYQVQFGAQGGVPPYGFTLVSGTLPTGLTFSPAGLLSGTATAPASATLLVRVTDAQGTTAQREYQLSIVAQPISGGSLSLSSAIGVSNTQNEVDVTISSPQPDTVTGTITLTLNSLTNPPVDDPAVQFVSGGRTASFTIPAGQTSANFGQNPTARFQTGTTAANLVFTAAFQRNGQDATPTPAPQASLSIPVTPPTLTDLGVTRNGNNLTVVVRGFAPERSITTAVLEFTRRAGAPGTNPERFDVNVATAFQQWFSGAASQPFGSQFRLTIPVTLTGDPADITGLTVRLTGPTGTGNSLTASF